MLRSAATLEACALKLGTALVAGLVAEEACPGSCTGPAAAATERFVEGGKAEVASSPSGRKLGLHKNAAAASLPGGLAPHARGPGALDAADVLADVCGDGEVCWERLAAMLGHYPLLAAQVLTQQGEAQAAGHGSAGSAVPVAESGQTKWAGWLVQLMQVEAGRAGSVCAEVQEVMAQSMGLRLLLSTLRAWQAS